MLGERLVFLMYIYICVCVCVCACVCVCRSIVIEWKSKFCESF